MKDYYLKWTATSECPLDCEFCNNKMDREFWKKEMDESKVVKFVDAINNNEKVKGITISGGEPTVYKNFNYVCENLIKPFGIITSGINIYNGSFDKLFLNNKFKFITFSLDGLDSKLVECIRGVNILENQLKSISYISDFKKAHPNVELEIFINTVLTNDNYLEITKLIEFAHQSGVRRVQLLKFSTSGDTFTDEKLRLSLQKEIEVTDRLVMLYKENKSKWEEDRFNLLMRHLPGYAKNYFELKHGTQLPIRPSSCGIHRNTIYLKTDGTLNLCKVYDRRKFADYKTKSFEEIDFDYVENEILNQAYRTVNAVVNYKEYTPCNECNLFLNGCNPCVAFGNNTDAKIVFEECNIYKNELIKVGDNCEGL